MSAASDLNSWAKDEVAGGSYASVGDALAALKQYVADLEAAAAPEVEPDPEEVALPVPGRLEFVVPSGKRACDFELITNSKGELIRVEDPS